MEEVLLKNYDNLTRPIKCIMYILKICQKVRNSQKKCDRTRSVRSTHLKRVRSLIQATPMTSTLEIDTSGGSSIY